MRVIPKKRAVILHPKHAPRVQAVIPHAQMVTVREQQLLAVRHSLDETKVLRNLGYPVPSPILHYYDWPRAANIKSPFEAQLHTAAMLTLNPRAYVLNGLGSGKTQATLWAFDYLRRQGKVRRMLVVAPLSTLELTWAQAIFEHFPHLECQVVHNSNRARRLKQLAAEADVYVTNHDGAKIIADDMAKREDIGLIVVDELAQCARNARTDRWRSLNTLINKQSKRMAWGLTATPTPNEPVDAWAQCRLITAETVPKTFTRFRDAVMQQIGPYLWRARPNATEVVYEAMQPAIRYSREECVDLPPTTYSDLDVPLTGEQLKAYKEMEQSLKAQLADGDITAVNEAVKANKLVQIACGVVYSQDHEELRIPNKPRVQETLDLIRESHGKVIVFVPFISALQHLKESIEKAGYSVGVIHGGVSKRERDDVFANFQRNDMLDVIAAQPAAMSHGLTLTAASTIIWFAPITSADIFEQANGRITRPGQKHNTLIAMISGTAIERRMYSRLKSKQKMQGLLLDKVVAGRIT